MTKQYNEQVEVRKVSFLITQTLFIVVCFYSKRQTIAKLVVRTQLERFRDDVRWRVSEDVVALFYIATLQPPV